MLTYGKGDTVRVALDLDWLPPGGGCHATHPPTTGCGRGRVDFYKNGKFVGGTQLTGWNGERPLFAGITLDIYARYIYAIYTSRYIA
jgi:hypothetical protein